MDPAALDPKILAEQLRKPEGTIGEAVGTIWEAGRNGVAAVAVERYVSACCSK